MPAWLPLPDAVRGGPVAVSQAPAVAKGPWPGRMHDVIKQSTEWVAVAVEAAAVLVVALAVAQAVLGFLRAFLTGDGEATPMGDAVRLRLARWLMLALEFALAADILRTAIAPGWDEIGKLAAIAALRTVLNFFLQREMEHAARIGR